MYIGLGLDMTGSAGAGSTVEIAFRIGCMLSPAPLET
jgi:hypothetical protein